MGKTAFVDGNPALGQVGTLVTAAFLNALQNHRHDGLDQDGSAPLAYAAAGGTANAITLALTPSLTAHIPGMPICFKAAIANTGACTLAVNGMDPVEIKQHDGSALPVGAIAAGQIVTVIYTGITYMLVSGRGIATNAEVAAGTNTGKVVTPAGLMSVFASSQAASGYQKLPSGVIFQWGAVDSAGTGSYAVTFPIAFPNACFLALATDKSSSVAGTDIFGAGVPTTSTVVFWSSTDADNAGGTSFYWFAIGN